MSDLLSNLDPTIIAGAIAAILALFKRSKDGDIKTYLEQAIKSALERKVLELIDRNLTGPQARAEIETEAASVLTRVGVKRSAVIDILLHAVVEAAMGRLEAYLFKQRAAVIAVGDATDKLVTGAQGVLDAFDESKTGSFPKLGLNIEYVSPDDPTEPAPRVELTDKEPPR